MNIKIPYTDTTIKVKGWRHAFTLLFTALVALIIIGPPALFAFWFLFIVVDVMGTEDDLDLGPMPSIFSTLVVFALTIFWIVGGLAHLFPTSAG